MQAKQILEDANKRANEMIRQAEEIEKKRRSAIVEMKSQIAELAMLAAERFWTAAYVYGQDALVDRSKRRVIRMAN